MPPFNPLDLKDPRNAPLYFMLFDDKGHGRRGNGGGGPVCGVLGCLLFGAAILAIIVLISLGTH